MKSFAEKVECVLAFDGAKPGIRLPEGKIKLIRAYQRKDRSVCMVGDRINDVPVMKKVDVGIVMFGIGSNIAVNGKLLLKWGIMMIPHSF